MSTVTIIIVNYNGRKCLSACLDALSQQTRMPDEVIVADNGSTDGSLEILANYPAITIMALGENTGFAKANNLAAKNAKGDYIALLNPDAYAAPGWLAVLMATAEKFSDAVMLGSTQLAAGDESRFDGTGDCYHAFGIPYRSSYGMPVIPLPEYHETFAPCAAAALYKREVYLASGGLDERFFCYCEDVDLGFRLRLLGHTAIQVSNAVVRHEGSGITGGKSDFTIYHSARNRLWVFVKNMPALLFWPLLPFHVAATLFFWLRFVRVGAGRAYGRGVKDALCGLYDVWQQRQEIQKKRTAGIWSLARALTWSLPRLARREGEIIAKTI